MLTDTHAPPTSGAARSTGIDRRVGVYLSVESSLQSAQATFDVLRAAGSTPVLYVEPNIRPAARTLFDNVVVLQHDRRTAWLNKASSFVIQNLTAMPLGDNELVRERPVSTGKLSSLAAGLLRKMPRIAPRTLNRWSHRLSSRLVRNPFDMGTVHAITPVSTPVLLNHRSLDVTVILDSWDQPVRRTAGFVARRALAWNLDLAADWQQFQGCESLGTIEAYRLKYALESTRRLGTWTSDTESSYVLYPMATSPNRPNWYSAELLLVRAVCEGTQMSGHRLLVKPKPNAGPGELEALISEFDHVEVGHYLNTEVTDDWQITSEYNRSRLDELDGASCVISTATTFALDAATAGLPILQLDIRDVRELGDFASAAHNSHLVRHLYPIASASLRRPDSLEDLVDVIASLDSLKGEMTEASDTLAAWIWNDSVPGTASR